MHIPDVSVVSSLLDTAVHTCDDNNSGAQSACPSEKQPIRPVRVPEKYPDLFGSDDEIVYVAEECSGAALLNQFRPDL